MMAGTVARSDEEPPDKPGEFALDDSPKEPRRPPRSGATLEVPKAQIVEGGKHLIRVQWVIKYTGDRWPLAILEPSLKRESSGQTQLLVIAKGKSGKAYYTVLKSPSPIRPLLPPKDWFLIVPKEKGKAEGVLEADLAEAKRRFLKYYPAEFDAKVAPELYVRLDLDISERGYQVDLDAWTGYLMASPVKVADPKW